METQYSEHVYSRDVDVNDFLAVKARWEEIDERAKRQFQEWVESMPEWEIDLYTIPD